MLVKAKSPTLAWHLLRFGMTKLETLGIMGTQVTSAGMQSLRDLRSLRSLNLDHTQVDDAGVELLGGAKQSRPS